MQIVKSQIKFYDTATELRSEIFQQAIYVYYSKTCLKRTPYMSENWTNGKEISERRYFPCKIIL